MPEDDPPKPEGNEGKQAPESTPVEKEEKSYSTSEPDPKEIQYTLDQIEEVSKLAGLSHEEVVRVIDSEIARLQAEAGACEPARANPAAPVDTEIASAGEDSRQKSDHSTVSQVAPESTQLEADASADRTQKKRRRSGSGHAKKGLKPPSSLRPSFPGSAAQIAPPKIEYTRESLIAALELRYSKLLVREPQIEEIQREIQKQQDDVKDHLRQAPALDVAGYEDAWYALERESELLSLEQRQGRVEIQSLRHEGRRQGLSREELDNCYHRARAAVEANEKCIQAEAAARERTRQKDSETQPATAAPNSNAGDTPPRSSPVEEGAPPTNKTPVRGAAKHAERRGKRRTRKKHRRNPRKEQPGGIVIGARMWISVDRSRPPVESAAKSEAEAEPAQPEERPAVKSEARTKPKGGRPRNDAEAARAQQLRSQGPLKKQDRSNLLDGAKLTDKQRECASLAWECELSVSEIARLLGRHRSTIALHLALANKKIDEAKANERHARNIAKSGAP